MFSVGDKVVYPMYGAGTIVGIDEKKILGEKKKYYVFELPTNGVDIMIPVDSQEQVGVRPIATRLEIENAIGILSDESTPMDENWNRRYRENMAKLKSGDIYETAEVVRNLYRLGNTRTLSQGERKMLTNAITIFSSEMIFVLGISAAEAENRIIASI